MRLFYSDGYVQARHGYDTTRKSQWIAESLISSPIQGVEIIAPERVSALQLCDIHDPKYVHAVKTGKPRRLAQSQRFPWDEGIFHAACASTGGAVAAVEAALKDGVAGSLSSGLHHARRKRGKGNCTFNGLALAAHRAKQCGARSILVLDADAHFGGGTHSLVRNMTGVTHVDIATNPYDIYVRRGNNAMSLVMKSRAYLPMLASMLTKAEKYGPYDLCIYNAGMDPHEDCKNGGLRGITADMLREREQSVFTWCKRRKIPVAFVIAGGYVSRILDQTALVNLHRSTIEAAVGLS